MSSPSLVLLVTDNSANVRGVREALAGSEEKFTLQHVERVRTALARIAGGGVTVILLDVSGDPAGKGREALEALEAGAPDLPLIVLCGVEDEAAVKQLLAQKAVISLFRPDWHDKLTDSILGATSQPATASSRSPTRGSKGTVIAISGAKGGVGATTVAVNLASLLASSFKVILAELRPPFGTLCHFFRPHRAARSLQNLLALDRAELQSADVESSLWPNRNIPGLSVLFAPERAASVAEIEPGPLAEILRRLAELGEVVIVDLPSSLSEADRVVIEGSDILALVVERDVLSVDSAKAKLSALESLGIIPQEAGLVIVNRAPLAAPMALQEIESQLGLPIFAVIPPAADLCAAAYRVHIPLVKLDAQSSVATSFVSLAKRLSARP